MPNILRRDCTSHPPSDASEYGLGAALLKPSKHHDRNTLHESCLQSVVYSSKSLTPTEQRYAQNRKRMPRNCRSFQQI